MSKTEFDLAVEQAKTSLQSVAKEDLEGVQLLLKQAGVADTKIAEIRANPSMVALIKANPDLVTRLAQMYPAAYAINYFEARQQAGLGLQTEPADIALNPELSAASRGTAGPPISPTGAQEFAGGVFVQDGQVFFPPNDPNVMGSPAWMAQVPKWSEEQRQTWAKTLKQMGYIESAKVDLVTFTDALRTYHQNRYLYGGGNPVDISVGAKGVTKADFGGILDPAVLDTEARSLHQEVYGANDEPSPEELKRLRQGLERSALRIARNKDFAPADAASVASARVQEKFRASPAVQKWQELEETDTSLHDSFVNLFQVLSS